MSAKLLQDSVVANSPLYYLLPISVSQHVGFGSKESDGMHLRYGRMFDHFVRGIMSKVLPSLIISVRGITTHPEKPKLLDHNICRVAAKLIGCLGHRLLHCPQ